MIKLASIFPGQGTQKVGMCLKLSEQSNAAKLVFDEVDDALNAKLSKIIFEGPEDALMRTENTQPALMACSIATLRTLEQESGKRLKDFCSYLAGHSLGEFTALVAANSISLSGCAKLLKVRGKAMQNSPKGSMFALLGANIDVANQIANQAEVYVANDNAPTQQVLSGHTDKIETAIKLAHDAGYKAIKLNVSAAFHSPLMQDAKTILATALNQTNISSPDIAIIANVSGELMPSDPASIKETLLPQLTSTVKWCKSIQTMHSFGVEAIAEVGPGTVYTNLVKRIDTSIKAIALTDIEAINLFIEEYLKP